MSTTPAQPNHDGPGAQQPPSAPPAPGFPAAPQYAGSGVAAPVGEQPASIRLAVRLMYVGAALSVLGIVTAWATRSEVHDRLVDSVSTSGSTLTADQVDTLVTVSLIGATVMGLVGVGLWVWMAFANGAGKAWARVVATVLGGLNVLSLLATVATGRSSTVSTVTALVTLALAVAILVLLWRRESSEFYRVRSVKR